MAKNLGLLQTQTFGVCAGCKINNNNDFTDERGNIYCGPCAMHIMEIPQDTPVHPNDRAKWQEELNKAVKARDIIEADPLISSDTPVITSYDDITTPEEKKEDDAIKFVVRKIKTGLVLYYNGEEHYFTSKSGLIRHMRTEVL